MLPNKPMVPTAPTSLVTILLHLLRHHIGGPLDRKVVAVGGQQDY